MKISRDFRNQAATRLSGLRRRLAAAFAPRESALWRAATGPADLSPAQQRAVVQRSGLFDADHYARETGAGVRDALDHFLQTGAARGRSPNPLFDPAWYLRAYPDAEAWRANPLLHYILHGAAEGRATSAGFDGAYYLATYPDIARAGLEPLRHFLAHGRREGRTGARRDPVRRGGERVSVGPHVELGVVRAGDDLRTLFPQARAEAVALLTQHLAMGGVLPAILHLTHPWGGGTERHIFDVAVLTGAAARHHVLQIRPGGGALRFELLLAAGEGFASYGFAADSLDELASFIALMKPQRLHVHYALDVLHDLPALIAISGVPFDVSVHDFGLICPRVHLVGPDGAYCGEPDETGCGRCLSQPPAPLSRDIAGWRADGRKLLEGAQRVICPSVDAAQRMRRYAPGANLIVAPHEADLYRPLAREVRPVAVAARIRVAVLGALAEHKGGAFLLDCVEEAARRELPLDWTAIGWFPPELNARAQALSATLSVTGPYEGAEIDRVIASVDPHVVLFPQRCPETYCYALSEALAAGRVVLAPDIGAFSERLAGVEGAQLYPAPASVSDVLERLMRRVSLEGAPFAADPALTPDVDFYVRRYPGGI